MSATIKLSTKLPGDPEINGLDAQHGRLISDDTAIVCLAWVVPTKVTKNIETEEEIPTVEIRRLEPIAPVDQAPTSVINMAAELYERRTGRNPLPIGQLVSPAGDVDELDDDEPVNAGDVAEAHLKRVPEGDVFVFDPEEAGDV